MEQNVTRRSARKKRPTHPLICLLWALIVVLVIFNLMMVIKLTAGNAETPPQKGNSLSSLDKNLVED